MLHVGVLALIESRNIPEEPICLLNPEAPLSLHCEVKRDMWIAVVIQLYNNT
jgi:hypothetical protein